MPCPRGDNDMSYVSLELKICEVCGGLWVRPRGQRHPYCARCRKRLADFPRREVRRVPVRRTKHHATIQTIHVLGRVAEVEA
jgi:hypothetical protein